MLEDSSWSERLHMSGVRALYVHIPFCAQKCAYCDFASWQTASYDALMEHYQASIESQIQETQELGLLEDCQSAYIGGGTPTLLGKALGRLVSHIRMSAPVRELSCEANPDSLTDGVLASLHEAGATRLSIGVQSFEDRELALLGRIHTAQEAFERVEAALALDFDVSCDFMCALEGQTERTWRHTLLTFLQLGADHVSIYPLTIEEGTPLARRARRTGAAWNDQEIQAERMQEAKKILEGARYARYEVASYARNNAACLHNIAYWTALPYLGLGTHAASMLTSEGYAKLRSLQRQLPAAPHNAARVRLTVQDDRRTIAAGKTLADTAFDVEFLSAREAVAEDLMLGARLSEGLSEALVQHARETLGVACVDETLESCVRDELLAQNDAKRLAPTEMGWLMGNELYGRLWDLH